ncbi:MAG: peptidylprolyl isomerase [Polyangiales bacterium]
MAISPDTPAPAINIAGDGELRATLKTNKGDITVKLFEAEAPRTVANFVALATGGVQWSDGGKKTDRALYSGTVFHRVIPELIQGGDPEGTGRGGGPGYRFADEIHPSLRHDRAGILSMANAGPNTNGSQFFITEKATNWLDGRHTVFGSVIDGMDIVHAIANVRRDGNDRPLQDVVLEQVDVFRA